MDNLNFIKKKIREWTKGYLKNSCKTCKDNCCNLKKHAIAIDEDALNLFQEKGIFIFHKSNISKYKLSDLQKDLFLKNNSRIVKPAVVYISKEKRHFLYADNCPFFKKNACQIHSESRRPLICQDYPIKFLKGNSELEIQIKGSCPAINEDFVEAFQKRFKGIEIIS